MLKRKGPQSAGIAALTLALLLAVAPGGVRSAKAQGTSDAQIQADVQKALDKKQYKSVQATVQNGEVTLRGSVDFYADKESADNRAHHVKKVKGVDNLIEVAGPIVEDVTLRNKLANSLATDRVGYGTTAFNSLTVAVQNGVVTLGGTVYGPPDKDSALSLVANTPGVKDIVDNIDVLPLSPMDDQLRLRLANVIYGTTQLQKYALDPAKPIRITVVNGNVTLTGVVDSKADSDIAGIRANGVPGVFKVTNNLQVAGAEAKK
jgi:hyperosmotically inducible periplasmic protein